MQESNDKLNKTINVEKKFDNDNNNNSKKHENNNLERNNAPIQVVDQRFSSDDEDDESSINEDNGMIWKDFVAGNFGGIAGIMAGHPVRDALIHTLYSHRVTDFLPPL